MVREKRINRRTTALLWLLAAAFVIGILIYLEQIALLYVLATVSLVALLLIVGFSDLEKIGHDAAIGFSGKNEQ